MLFLVRDVVVGLFKTPAQGPRHEDPPRETRAVGEEKGGPRVRSGDERFCGRPRANGSKDLYLAGAGCRHKGLMAT